MPFSEEDDELILELKDNRGMSWEDINELFFKDRRVTQIQYRYYAYLRPDCSKEFTEEDDNLLRELKARLDEERNIQWARELEKSVHDNGHLASDLKTLREQAQRCREILGKITQLSSSGASMAAGRGTTASTSISAA